LSQGAENPGREKRLHDTTMPMTHGHYSHYVTLGNRQPASQYTALLIGRSTTSNPGTMQLDLAMN